MIQYIGISYVFITNVIRTAYVYSDLFLCFYAGGLGYDALAAEGVLS